MVRVIADVRAHAIVVTPQAVVATLLDVAKATDERIDAALMASEFDNQEIEAALLQLASDTESELTPYAAESLAQIWVRKGTPNIEVIKRLPYAGQQAIKNHYVHNRPQWLALLAP